MTCREIVEFLMRYLDGELPPQERAVFEEHLGECPECVAYLSTYREAVRLCREAFDDPRFNCEQIPEDLVQAILAARPQGARET